MILETKVRKIGNSLGVVLPKEALLQLHVEEGATLYLTPSAEGALRMTAEREGFADKAKIADSLMQRYRNAFRELAK
jgi:putative addiction module antidote